MLNQPLPDLNAWVRFFSEAELPVLRQTVRRLEDAQRNIDRIGGRELAEIILQDPLMAIRVLSFIQSLRSKHLRTDITTIANAIMMLGIEPFFARFSTLTTIESKLGQQPQALLGVLHVIRRMQRAAHYAHDWAFERLDMNVEEVALAALLHDLAEILLWCFAPQQALEIRRRQQIDPTLRSATAQEDVLGIRLADLQLALCQAWQLPELLKTLMDDSQSEHPRVRNVVLAVNLARHSAENWENPGLPDDFRGIEKLLHVDRDILLQRLSVPEEIAVRYLGPQEPPTQN